MPNRHFKRAGVTLGAILAALLFFLGGAALRLLMGPISLGPFAGAIEDSINRSISGLVIRFDQAVLEWSRTDGQINLLILGTNVFDGNGRIVAQAPTADLDFDVVTLLAGDFALKRFTLLGVQLTAVRDVDGKLSMGFGSTEGDVDLLEIIRNTLQENESGGGSLENFSVRDARLAFRDDESGLFLVSPETSFAVENNGGRLDASLDALIEISGAPAHLVARAALGDDGLPQSGSFDLRGLDLAALAENSPSFARLAPYALKTDIAASYVLASDGGVIAASFDLDAVGAIVAPVLGESFLGTPFQIDGLAIEGRYDGPGNRLAVDRAEITGPQGSGRLSADLRLGWEDGRLVSLGGEVEAEEVRLEIPELFAELVQLSRLSVRADYDLRDRSVDWHRVALSSETLVGEFSGVTTFPESIAPAISLTGTVDEIAVQDGLKYWPLTINDGARTWIAEHVPEGFVGPIGVDLEIPAGALDSERLPEDVVAVVFPVRDVTAHYFGELTPLTGGRGSAKLSGDTFELRISEANIGPLTASDGVVSIPNLHIRHAPGDFTARVEGSMSDVLTLIDMQPLGYPTRFHVEPDEVDGIAGVDLSFSLPMRRDLAVDEVHIGVSAEVSGLGLPIGDRRQLTGGNVKIEIDNARLSAEGTADVSGVPVLFTWNEEFVPEADISTQINVLGTLDDEGQVALGLVVPEWLSGPISGAANFTGWRFDLQGAEVRADLTRTHADIRAINLTKEPGQQANARAMIAFEEGGSVAISDMVVTGDEMDIRGELFLDQTRRLARVSLPIVRIGPDDDFALQMELNDANVPAWRVRGRSLDASRLVGQDDEQDAGTADLSGERRTLEPISVDVQLERVVLRNENSFENVALELDIGEAERLVAFRVEATVAGSGKVTGELHRTDGLRSLALESDQAGAFLQAVTDIAFVRDGTLRVQADFPPDSALNGGTAPADYTGTIVLEDFSVVDQPFLARLLSVGSLTGPLRLLQGQGIAFNRLEAPFSAQDGLVTLSDGRASGSAIGVSFQGVVDRDADTMDIQGSLAPVYGLNSVLGALPVIGDILISKEGEGIIGLTYQARGALDEPQISVNPLSILTPGIFRRIFEFGGPEPQRAEPQRAEPQGTEPAPAAPPPG